MNVLVLGSGGREHALGWKLAQGEDRQLFFAPGNPGMAVIGTCLDLDIMSPTAVYEACQAHGIDLVVIGPEAPLVDGVADVLRAAEIKVFGPGGAGAQLEGSKRFTKLLCERLGVPTAGYQLASSVAEAEAALQAVGYPCVVKADGLAAGKGVVIAGDYNEAREAVEACFAGRFGEAGRTVVIEEFLEGEEASFFALTDGVDVVAFGSAQDHKRAFDGDAGPNTGGMGAYTPAPVMSAAHEKAVMTQIIEPVLRYFREAGTPYQGVLYAGLMITAQGPKLIEFNVRFGDPECQVLMMRLKSDLLPLLLACAQGGLKAAAPEWYDDVAITVVMAADGYPGAELKTGEIRGLEQAAAQPGVEIFHAGTRLVDGRLMAAGGRVLNISARGAVIEVARARAYEAIRQIDWPQGFYRKDIGVKAIGRSMDAASG